MLGKLFKYDMKNLSRLLIFFHIPMIILAFVGKYWGIERMYDLGKPDLGSLMALIPCVIYWSFISLLTQLYIAIYTYRSFFTHQGYLTFTLPVKPDTHVLSKFLSGSLWFLLDAILLQLSLVILCSSPRLLADIKEDMPEILSFFQVGGTDTMGIIMASLTFFGALSGMALILASLAFGHCFSKHRILISVLGYFGINTLLSVLGGAVGASVSLRNIQYMERTGDSLPFTAFINTYQSVLIVSIIAGLTLGIACYVFSCYVFRKKINLD